jgi:hypothetical protein
MVMAARNMVPAGWFSRGKLSFKKMSTGKIQEKLLMS